MDAQSSVGDDLRRRLVAGARALWEEVRAQHPGEHPYGFLFVLEPEGYSVAAAVPTEEWLTRFADAQARAGYGGAADGARAVLRDLYRWTDPEDGWYGLESTALKDVSRRLRDAYRDHTFAYYGDATERLCLEALRELDGLGVFGRGAERDAVVLGLWYAEQDDETFVRFARQVNPPAVCARLEGELARVYWAQEREAELRRGEQPGGAVRGRQRDG